MILAQTGSTLRVVSLGLACLVLGLFQLGYLDWVGRVAQRWRPVAPQPPLVVAQPEQGNIEDAAGQPTPAIPQVDSVWRNLAITLLSFVTSIFPLGEVPA